MNDYLEDFLNGKLVINLTNASVESLKILDKIIDIPYNSGQRLYELENYALSGTHIICKFNVLIQEKRLFITHSESAISYKDFIYRCKDILKDISIDTEDVIGLFE